MDIQIERRDRSGASRRYRLRYTSINRIRLILIYLGDLVIIFKWEFYSFRYHYRQFKTFFRVNYNKLRDKLVHAFKMRFGKKRIYYVVWSRDCDLCESVNYGYVDSYKEYVDWMNDEEEWSWVEGSTSVDIISKGEYDYQVEQEHPVRDRVMEAFENGNGRNVII
jgi:hypothetical protein